MDYDRVSSYIGVDIIERYFYENGYMRLAYFSSLLSMALVPALYLLAYVVYGLLWPRIPSSSKDSNSKTDSVLISSAMTNSTVEDSTSGRQQRRSARMSRRRSSYQDQYSTNQSALPPLSHRNSTTVSSVALRVSWCCLIVNTVLSIAFVVPTTMVWLDFVSDPYWIQVSQLFVELSTGLSLNTIYFVHLISQLT